MNMNEGDEVENIKMNILHIPEKRGRKGHPKITVTTMEMFDGYEVQAYCEYGLVRKRSLNQLAAMNYVLKGLFDILENK